jgi:mannose-6-phosphate isomerase-like protein (cupin superfamily)
LNRIEVQSKHEPARQTRNGATGTNERTMTSNPIDFAEKLSKFSEHWSPRFIAEMNDYQFKLVKFQGEFVWHDHKATDDAFVVLDGEMEIGFRDRVVTVRAGEMFAVLKGIEHITRAACECHALIIEPRGVVNTGDRGGVLTAQNDVWVWSDGG